MPERHDDAYWREKLTPEQYRVLRQRGTEPAFAGAYYDKKDAGVYRCAACGQALFSSRAKYDSGSGWPSFWDTIDKSKLELTDDYSFGMHRIEVNCATCGGHLGHLFPDGPKPTGQRYCLSSPALNFEPEPPKQDH